MSAGTDVGALVREARAHRVARLDAELLVGHHLGLDRAAILARPERGVTGAVAERIRTDLRRRAGGVPIAQLRGYRDFLDLRLEVNADVLVPRPETETLVEAALARIPEGPAVIADLGTGSGAVALALASRRPAWKVVATDRSEAALAVARRNARRLRLDVAFVAGDWCRPLGAPLDAIVCNPPYVADDDAELDADVRAHEPGLALFAGADGLAAIRVIAADAAACLVPGGRAFLEHGHRQGGAVRSILRDAGLEDVSTLTDASGRERVTLARRPARRPARG